MAFEPSCECSWNVIKRYRCECEVSETELSDLSDLAKNDLTETCLGHLQEIGNLILQNLKQLSQNAKKILNNHSNILLESKSNDPQSLLEAIKTQTSKIIEDFMEELKDFEKTKKAVKSFVKFLHEKNSRSKNKKILTKFL